MQAQLNRIEILGSLKGVAKTELELGRTFGGPKLNPVQGGGGESQFYQLIEPKCIVVKDFDVETTLTL
jgi:hypothetical protein